MSASPSPARLNITLCEIESHVWTLQPTFSLAADKTGKTVREHLEERGVRWQYGGKKGDVFLKKGGMGKRILPHLRTICTERLRHIQQPTIALLGEPRHVSAMDYRFAKKDRTLVVAPGNNLKRLFFASEWKDPQLENWSKRLPRICWIGIPYPERVELAQKMLENIHQFFFSSQWEVYSFRAFYDRILDVAFNLTSK